MYRHWFTIKIERFEIEIAQFLLSNSIVTVFKFKLQDFLIQM
jgi:hypothetical protein